MANPSSQQQKQQANKKVNNTINQKSSTQSQSHNSNSKKNIPRKPTTTAITKPDKVQDPRFQMSKLNDFKSRLGDAAVDDFDDDEDQDQDPEEDGLDDDDIEGGEEGDLQEDDNANANDDDDNDDEPDINEEGLEELEKLAKEEAEQEEENDDNEPFDDPDDDVIALRNADLSTIAITTGSFDINPASSNTTISHEPLSNPNAPVLKPISMETLKKFNDKVDKSGVVYLSRVPPFMSPAKLRQLLGEHGALGRVYLAPEDPTIAHRRRKYRHNRRQNFTEAWVEFEDKKLARKAAEFLNTRNIGGKKRGRFYDDLWSIKYLPRFKWHHLSEQIAYERAVRDQRLRAEMAAVKRENQEYMKNVGKAKMIEAIEEKKNKKRKAEEDAEVEEAKTGVGKSSGDGDAAAPAAAGSNRGFETKVSRQFKQRKVKSDEPALVGKKSKKAAILAKIFG
ncbi:Activator of basal transcription 1 [Blyttiomyces sp. JEL0837]|nr:Activator of basal transcription 1 [Blyttiomyces sp. JEL0837]